MNENKLQTALNQWRDSLINLSSKNKLLNYKKTRASTIEFTELSAVDIYDRLLSRTTTYIVGTKPEPVKKDADLVEDELEELVIDEIQDFDYSKHKDSLFTAITQRDVDRTLKTIASAARREYLDKGISPLYLALGALSWQDESEDQRTSPLIMVPVELTSSGPKEPLHISRSDDDISVNPALALKLSEFGISLPTSEEVIEAIENGNLEDALELFTSLKLEPEWEVQDFATLAVFAFQKEAMYRDLLDNEELVLENSVIQALGGGTTPEESDFYFEPIEQNQIDEIAPPESTPLVLDADSSQRAAVAAAVAGHSFVLDGPPGTGKSQTISNIIGALIDQGKSVLFVSEKIVALEVVKDRLDQRGLGAFLFELHSHKATRKEVAKQLGKALKLRPVPPNGLSSLELSRAEELRTQLNEYAEAMNEIREPLDVSVHEVLGLLEQLDVHLATPKLDIDVSELVPSEFERIRDAIDRVGKHWDLYLAGESAEWYGLENQDELAFRIESAISALSSLEKNYSPIHAAAVELRMDGTFYGDNLYEILEFWASGADFQDEKWLTSENLGLQQSAIDLLSNLDKELASFEENCVGFLGSKWSQISSKKEPKSPSDFSTLNSTVKEWGSIRTDSLQTYSSDLHDLQNSLSEEIPELEALCEIWGISELQQIGDLEDFHFALQVLASKEPPPIEWIKRPKNRKKAKEAYESLKPLVDNLKDAESQASVFIKGVIELDLQAISDFFEVNQGFFKSFSKPYREQKQRLKAFSKAGNWKSTLTALPFAMAWQSAAKKLSEAEEEYSKALSPLYKSSETDWEAIGDALKVSKQILAAFEVIDVDRFEDAIESKSSKQLLNSRIMSLGKINSAWKNWSIAQGTELRTGVLENSLSEIQNRLDGISKEIVELEALVSLHKKALPEGIELQSLILGLGEAWKYSQKVASLSGLLKNQSKILNSDISIEEIRSTDFYSALASKMSWTLELRKLINQGQGSDDVELPLSSAEFNVLKAAKLPDSFKESSEAWQKKWSTLKDSFSSDVDELLDQKVFEFKSAEAYLKLLKKSLPAVASWFDLKRSIETIDEFGLTRSLESATEQELGQAIGPRYVLKSLLSQWVNYFVENDDRLGDDPTYDRSYFVEKYRDLDIKLKDNAISEIIRNGAERRPKSGQGQAGHIEREAEKKTRHIPVRDLIYKSRDVIQGLHPCFMMSPLAVSQYLPADIKFDVVIFDEASQVTPADAINCAYRGKALITAGDQKQLPPMSFFATSGLEDANLEEDVAGDYDSVLDLMKASGSFNSMTLNWHYRSRHEHLIAYSNYAFYDRRLITFPGAIAESDDLGVKFFKVDGVYRRAGGADNPKEAKEVARRVIHHFDTRPGQSLGVVAFSTNQRDAIENAVAIARSERPDLEKYFEGNRQDGFFVNSLEAVQGDERDVIIFSIGYGPDEAGKIYKNFGPLNRAGGERRLNVAITRARKLVEIVSSMTSAELGEVKNEGARHLRKYLDFAERGPIALQMELGSEGLGTDSPFEDSVISAIQSWGYEVQPQVGVAGYRIDIGVKHPNNPGAFILGVECDGAMYHSSKSARDRDRLRHEILEGLGWRIHHIWGTAWYRHRDRELARLKSVIEEQAEKQVSGRLVIEKSKKLVAAVEITFEENTAEDLEAWTEEYVISEPSTIPSYVDLSEESSARHLVPFVLEVVRIEEPIHKDLLLKRLRDTSNIGKVGSRIRKTVDRAIKLASIEVNGEFLWATSSREVEVRRANPYENRDISLIALEELREAILGTVKHATGIAQPELIQSVRQIYGWKRSGSQIENQISQEIDFLVDSGYLSESGGGLTCL